MCQIKEQQWKSFEKNSPRRIQCLAGPPWQRKEDDVSGRRGFGAAGAEAAVPGTEASCAALGEEDGPEVREEPSGAPHFQCEEGKVAKQPRGNKSLIRDRLNWTGPWSKPACSGDRQGIPLARGGRSYPRRRRPRHRAAAAAPALLGETVPLRQGRTRLELKEAPTRRRRRALPGCSVKALREKKKISNL